MAQDTFGNELDATGQPVKKPGDVGYVPPGGLPAQSPDNGATVGLSKAALSGAAAPATAASTAQGNIDVLGKAQQDVLNQPAVSPLAGATEKATADWLAKPQGDFDPAKYKQGQMEKAQSDWANAYEAQRQQYGNVSGSGLLQQNMLQNALNQNVNQQALEGQIDTENYNRYVDSMGRSIAAGQAGTKQGEDIFSQRLQNLGTVRGMAEGAETRAAATTESALGRAQALTLQSNDIEGQKALTELQGKITSGQKLTEQDFAGAQAALDRAQKTVMQGTDITAQQNLAKLQNEFDIQKLNATQDWQSAQNKIQRDFELAKQSNDINATAANLEKQLTLDKWKQENGQTFTADQAALNRALESSLQVMKTTADKDLKVQEIAGSAALMTLKDKLDSKVLLNQQDFAKAQAELDRKATLALKMEDINGTKQIQIEKAALDMAAQDAQRKWQSAEDGATRSWQTGERLSTAALQTAKDNAAQYFDAQEKRYLQTQDIAGQKALATMKNQFDLGMQTNAMAHDEKMAYMASQYAEAKANNDVGRQKDILGFTYTQDLAKMTAADGFDRAKMVMQNSFDTALKNGDYAHATAMQEALFQQQSAEHDKDLVIENAKTALQAKGVDLAELEANYTMIQKQVEAGLVDPSVLTSYLEKAVKASGANVNLTPPDPVAQKTKADAEFKGLQEEFLRTHPEFAAPATIIIPAKFSAPDANGVEHLIEQQKTIPNPNALNDAGIAAFNAFVNKSAYGEAALSTTEGTKQAADAAVSDPVKYAAILKAPSTKDWSNSTHVDSNGWFGYKIYRFDSAPAVGSIFKAGDGVAYEALSAPKVNTKGTNREEFTARNLKTGGVITIPAYVTAEGGSLPDSRLNPYLNGNA